MKKIILLVMSILSLYISGCSADKITAKPIKGEPEKMNIEEKNKDSYATKEWVYKTFSLTDEDFKGIDLDVVFEAYPIEKETLKDFEPEKVILRLTKYYNKALEKKEEMKYDKSYLVKAKNSNVKCPSFDNIKYFAFDVARGTGNDSYLIDFEQAKMYYNVAYPVAYKDFSKAKYTIQLSEGDISLIKEALKGYKIYNWKYFYDGTSEVYEGFSWNLGMEFTDGTIISKSGVGESGKGAPTNLSEFEGAIDDIRAKYKK